MRGFRWTRRDSARERSTLMRGAAVWVAVPVVLCAIAPTATASIQSCAPEICPTQTTATQHDSEHSDTLTPTSWLLLGMLALGGAGGVALGMRGQPRRAEHYQLTRPADARIEGPAVVASLRTSGRTAAAALIERYLGNDLPGGSMPTGPGST
ncbi:hypothetical protein [Nocardia panacis]|uniref:hypothetical protein n=1 Tax=Nocardia panacis TaxID=2340916 RepID=UPI0011C470CB|nr:hypothetical protein [Nocardia panacis]